MKVLLFTTALVASAPTAPDTFAVECRGETFHTSVGDGKTDSQIFDLPDQIFVFSESSNIALRAMPRRSEFENICAIGSSGKVMEFSPEAIRVSWASPDGWEAATRCEFVFDRSEATATMRLSFTWSETRRTEGEWRMTCTPTQVPIYNQEER